MTLPPIQPDAQQASAEGADDLPFGRALFEATPSKCLALDPVDYRIVAVTDDYLKVTRRTRADLIGKILVEAFPDDPDDPREGGTANLLASFARVKATLQPDDMGLQRHPILNLDTGKLEERFWRPVNLPVLDSYGKLRLLIHSTEDVTERQQSEENLRLARSLERIAGMTAHVGGLMVELGATRTVTWAREIYGMCEWDGDNPPDISAIWALMQPASSQQVARAIQECEQEGKPFDLELPVVSFKGNPKWLRIVCEPESDAQGRIVRLIGAVQDITRQKTEQLHNQQLTTQLFSTLENMSDGFCLLGANWEIQYMNAEAERLLRIDRKADVGRHYFEVFPDCRGSTVHAGIEQAFKSGEAWHGEYYRELQQLWLSLSAFPSSDSLAIYFRSINEEKQMQQRIAESEERLQYVIEASFDVVWDSDLEKRTFWCNNGIQKFGYDFGEKVTSTEDWMAKVHPDDLAANRIAYQRMAADPAVRHWTCRYRFLTGSGKWVQFEDRSYIIRNEQGLPVRMVGGSTDVTKRMEMEEQLLQSQRLDALGQLTGGIAHDFNNLLTVILGNIELLQDELQPQQRLLKLTNNIDMAATRGANLTRQLLAFSRKQALQPTSLDVNKLLVNLKGMLLRTLGEHILIKLKLQENLAPAYVDSSQLEVALLNLCINARDAMPDGGTLTMESFNVTLDEAFSDTHMEVKPGDYVRISISDTGVGIPPEVLDRVFEPFFTTKDKDKGTGLGLSMVFGFVKQSNGHINIYSELGMGTTIRLYVPCSRGDITPLTETRPEFAGGNELVLLVEDNDLVRQLSQDLLRSLGYQVLSAGDGVSALEILESNPGIKLLLTDVVMPGMAGPELAKRAQALQPELKVLYASGYTQDSMMHNGKLDAGVHLLAKPYSKADLANKMREVLDARSDG